MRSGVAVFIQADTRLTIAADRKRHADEGYKRADREFRAAWAALNPTEQRAVNAALARTSPSTAAEKGCA